MELQKKKNKQNKIEKKQRLLIIVVAKGIRKKYVNIIREVYKNRRFCTTFRRSYTIAPPICTTVQLPLDKLRKEIVLFFFSHIFKCIECGEFSRNFTEIYELLLLVEKRDQTRKK